MLIVAACAGLPAPVIPLDGLPEAFDMAGRMSVTQEGRGDIARVRWTHSPGADFWVLSSPVGTELARIERTAEGLVVHRPGMVPMTAGSFADLTENLLGAALDERLLIAWLHGRPVAGPDNWTVTVDETRRFGSSDVARRITAIRDGITVKLVVDDYALPEKK
jgi:outer membrane biogenesis lipoprotein LolB